MTGTLAALVLETPASTVGVATRWANWRFVVQCAVPNTAYGRFDVSTFGNANFSDGYAWLDLSSRWRGAQWERGSTGLDQRPRTGEATLTLENNDGYLSRWNRATTFPARTYLGPDLVVRMGWFDQVAGVWESAFVGIVDEAEDDQGEGDADRWQTWTLVETTSLLALVDGAEQPAVGAGDDPWTRLDRLLDDAGWQFGTGTNFGGGFIAPTLQATTLAGNRLGEVYLTADTGFLDAFSDRQGRLDTWAKGFAANWTLADGTTVVGAGETAHTITGPPVVRVMPWAQAPRIRATKVGMYNRVSVARVGGSALGAEDQGSIGENGVSAYTRSDLLMEDDSDLETWAGYWLLFFADNTQQVSDVPLLPDLDTKQLEAITRLDFGRYVYLERLSPRLPSGATWTDTIFLCVVTGYTITASPASPGRALIEAALHVTVRSY